MQGRSSCACVLAAESAFFRRHMLFSIPNHARPPRTYFEQDAHRFARHPDPDHAAQDPDDAFVGAGARSGQAQPLIVEVFEPFSLFAFLVGQGFELGDREWRRRRRGRTGRGKDAGVAGSAVVRGRWAGQGEVKDADGAFGADGASAHERDLVSCRVGVEEVPSGGIVAAIEDEGVTAVEQFGRSLARRRREGRVEEGRGKGELDGLDADVRSQAVPEGVCQHLGRQ